jgi:hypothetical protein
LHNGRIIQGKEANHAPLIVVDVYPVFGSVVSVY